MPPQEPKFSRRSAPERLARMVETIYGCKWSLTVYNLLAHGINRPGAMTKHVEGLSKKVLSDCLRKNVQFGILARLEYEEVPPRVEYALTDFGKRFVRVLDDLERLQADISREVDGAG